MPDPSDPYNSGGAPASPAAPKMADEPPGRHIDTGTVTQSLEQDIIEFLTAKHTANATFEVEEVMHLYNCPVDRARRVIANLVKDQILVQVAPHKYKVNI